MALLRLDQFTIDPADTGELLTRHAALVAAARDAFPGLIEVQLAKVDDQTWLDMWRWDSLASAQAAAAGPVLPRHFRGCGEEANGRERPGTARPLRDPRRRRARGPVGGLVRRSASHQRRHADGHLWPAG